jgi:putative nucleotidyltransferase with HDIG domain
MDIVQFTIVVAVSTLDIGLGIAVLQRNGRSRTNRLFFASAVMLAVWLVLNFMSDQAAFTSNALVINQLTMAIGILMGACIMNFGITFPQSHATLPWSWRILLSLSVPLALLSFTPLIVEGITFESWGTNIILGPLYPAVVAWGIVCVALLIVTFTKNYQAAAARQRAQLAYLYMGLGSFGVASIMITGILPLLTGNNQYAHLSPLATLLFLLPTGYAIVRHRLLDVSFVVVRGAAYTVLVGLAAALVVVLAVIGGESVARSLAIQTEFVVFIAALAAILAFQPLRRWLDRASDRYLFRRTYDSDALLQRLAGMVVATLDLSELATIVATQLASEMKLSFAAVVYRHAPAVDVVSSGTLVPDVDFADLLQNLTGRDLLFADELDEASPLARKFSDSEVRVALPLALDSTLLGAVFLGKKLSGKMFSERDARFLTILSSQIAVSMKNAGLFDERNQRVRELVALSQLATTLGADIGLQGVIESALAEAANVTGADSGSIMLLDKETRTLSIAASLGLSDEVVDAAKVRVGEGISGWVAASRKALVVVDKNDPRLAKSVTRDEIVSAITAPVIYKDEVIGVINLNRRGMGEPFSAENLNVVTSFAGQLAVAIENARLYGDLEDTFIGTISALAAAVDAKDPHTYGHSHEVTDHAIAIAERIGLSQPDIDTIRLAALLHDIGKIGIDGAILNKPGALTDEERLVINHHPTIGADILAPLGFLQEVVPLILFHHERPDGKGYPSGIEGSAIPIGARIISVADSYNAMVSDRPYRRGLSESAARAELARNAGTQFDAELVDAFLEILEAQPS